MGALTQAVEVEVSEFLAATADLKTDDGCRRVVRHGHLPERQIMTGIGPVAVRQPRVRDREAGADDPTRIRFTPAILPPYARRSKSLDTLIPILYLKGVSTGDFAPALAALLGKDGPGLSAATIARLKDVWFDEHKRWSERDLSAKSCMSTSGPTASTCRRVWRTRRNAFWSSSAPRPRVRRSCSALSTARARALTTGARCCSISSAGVCRWRPRSPSLMARSASGRRSAKSGLGLKEQRCWVQATANILNKLPKSQQPRAKRMLQDIWMAETRKDAEAAFDAFDETYAVKYEKTAECLKKDRDPLLAFYDFPAEHWKHLRTSNPIESTFATVRHRTIRSKGCLSNRTALAMVFKLVEGAQKTWRRLDGHNQLPKIIRGVKFTDGCEVIANPGDLQSQTAAA